MSVSLRRGRDNDWRKYWYGEYREVDGKRCVVNLGPWEGTPPSLDLNTPGDAEFETSREAAETELQKMADDARRKGRADHLIERLIESKTGQSVEYVRLEEMHDKWLSGSNYSVGYKGQCKAVFERFLTYVKKQNPKAEFVYQVRPADVAGFMTKISKDMCRATAKAYIGILRPTFDLCLPSGMQNPFRAMKSSAKKTADEAKEGKGFHRIPFTPLELQAVIDASRADPLLHGIITACACTGMRRGDVCKLKWTDVDLKAGLVVAKASKTGETVEVPIFEPLRKVLVEARGNHKDLVFPEAAAMLAKNPDGLTWRFKKVVVAALAGQQEEKEPLQLADGFDMEADGTALLLKKLPPGERRERIVKTYRLYITGIPMGKVAETVGSAKSTVVADLDVAEHIIGAPVIRRRKVGCIKREITNVTRVKRTRGQRSASVRDWHALRTTYVTLALSAGVPVELVKRVTGHQTTAIVMEHYFRPDRDQFKAALTGALPEVLTGKAESRNSKAEIEDSKKELTELVEKVAAGTATKAETARFKQLAAGV